MGPRQTVEDFESSILMANLGSLLEVSRFPVKAQSREEELRLALDDFFIDLLFAYIPMAWIGAKIGGASRI